MRNQRKKEYFKVIAGHALRGGPGNDLDALPRPRRRSSLKGRPRKLLLFISLPLRCPNECRSLETVWQSLVGTLRAVRFTSGIPSIW